MGRGGGEKAKETLLDFRIHTSAGRPGALQGGGGRRQLAGRLGERRVGRGAGLGDAAGGAGAAAEPGATEPGGGPGLKTWVWWAAIRVSLCCVWVVLGFASFVHVLRYLFQDLGLRNS